MNNSGNATSATALNSQTRNPNRNEWSYMRHMNEISLHFCIYSNYELQINNL